MAMTPPSTRVSQPNSTRVLPAVVQHPDPERWICSERNVHTDALCHKPTPRRARRRELSFDCLNRRQPANRPWPQAQKLMYALLCGLLFFCQSAQASLHGSSVFDRELVYDRRPAPKPRMGLHARQDDSSSSPAATTATTTAGLSSIDAPSSTSSISESIIQTASSVPTSLPRPFDSSISSNNFTEPSCPQFFNDFLSSDTFQECLPFSLLLQVSSQNPLPTNKPNATTNPLSPDLQLLLHRNQVPSLPHPHPRRNLPPPLLPNLQHPNVLPRHPTSLQILRQRPLAGKPTRNASLRRPPRLRHPLRRLLPDLPLDGKLLLRRRSFEHVGADVVVHLLPAAWDVLTRRDEAGLHALSQGYDVDLCGRRVGQEGRVQGRLCAGGAGR
jgi:hypothetical protein